MKEFNKTLKIVLILAIAMAVFLLGLGITNFGKISQGIKIAGIKVGGLSFESSEALLENADLSSNLLKFSYQNITKSVALKDSGVNFDLASTLLEAYNLGRNKNPLIGIKEEVLALFGKYNLPLHFALNISQLEQWLKINFPIEKPAQNATLFFDSETEIFEVIPSKSGVIIDREKLKEDFSQRVEFCSSESIKIQLKKDFPKIKREQTFSAKNKVNQILKNSPYFLNYGGNQLEIEKEDLVSWIEFTPINEILEIKLNQGKIENHLIQISTLINREPINAQLTLERGRVIAFSLSRLGIRLEIEETAKTLSKNIMEGVKETNMIVGEIEPEISMESIENLGITSLLGVGKSNFGGSPKNRIHNIKLGAAKLQGILIKPGEEFSLNRTLGSTGPEAGYLPELVIKKGKTVPEYGGGLCQISTTCFRGAVNSGLKISERYPHAYPVKYYSPQGFDATIYPPHPDLRFINDTPGHILIQTKVEGYYLIFELYGTDDGREVKIIGPQILEAKPDGSMKTKLIREIYKEGELWRRDIFYSNYKSPALYPIEREPEE